MHLVLPPPGLKWLFFSPSGRLGRWSFFKAWLFWVASGCFLIGLLATHEQDPVLAGLVTLALLCYFPVAAVSLFMLAFKRAHDMGTSGMVALLLLVPFADMVYLAILFLAPPTQGANSYGTMSDWPDDQP